MIDEHNYEQWAMDYIEGTLGAEQRRAFDAFLAGHPAIAAQIGPLQSDLPVLPPETVVYPDKTGLLRGRTISLARRQDRLQRFGAMASGAAAAAVLFGGLLFFHPGEGTKGPERIAAEAAEAYPEGAEALAARFDRQEATDTGHDATTAGTGNAGTRNSIAAAVPATDATHAPAALAAHYGNTGDRTAASGQGTADPPGRETAPLPLRLSNARMRLRPRERLPKQVFSKIRCRRKVCWVRCRSLPNSTCRNLP